MEKSSPYQTGNRHRLHGLKLDGARNSPYGAICLPAQTAKAKARRKGRNRPVNICRWTPGFYEWGSPQLPCFMRYTKARGQKTPLPSLFLTLVEKWESLAIQREKVLDHGGRDAGRS